MSEPNIRKINREKLLIIIRQYTEGVTFRKLHEKSKDLFAKDTLASVLTEFVHAGVVWWEKPSRQGQKSTIRPVEVADWHVDRYRGLKLGLLGKDKKVRDRRWVNRTPRYLRNDGGILNSKGWRTEAWSRVYHHVAGKRFSLPEACHAEDLPYQTTNTQKEFRNEAYTLKQRWRKNLYPVDGHRTVEDSVFYQAIKNLEFKEPFEERKKAVKRAWELAGEGATEDRIAETLTIECPLLAKSYPRKKFSRHIVHDFLENHDEKIVPPQLRKKVREARAMYERPLVRRMKAKQEQNALLILQALNDSEADFGEILKRTCLPKSTANKNISILKKSGLVEQRTGWHGNYYLTTQGRLHLATIKAQEDLPSSTAYG